MSPLPAGRFILRDVNLSFQPDKDASKTFKSKFSNRRYINKRKL